MHPCKPGCAMAGASLRVATVAPVLRTVTPAAGPLLLRGLGSVVMRSPWPIFSPKASGEWGLREKNGRGVRVQRGVPGSGPPSREGLNATWRHASFGAREARTQFRHQHAVNWLSGSLVGTSAPRLARKLAQHPLRLVCLRGLEWQRPRQPLLLQDGQVPLVVVLLP